MPCCFGGRAGGVLQEHSLTLSLPPMHRSSGCCLARFDPFVMSCLSGARVEITTRSMQELYPPRVFLSAFNYTEADVPALLGTPEMGRILRMAILRDSPPLARSSLVRVLHSWGL
jgi:hypothetical protein